LTSETFVKWTKAAEKPMVEAESRAAGAWKQISATLEIDADLTKTYIGEGCRSLVRHFIGL
jgi:hypothetical protein